jgi:hypothetical protein
VRRAISVLVHSGWFGSAIAIAVLALVLIYERGLHTGLETLGVFVFFISLLCLTLGLVLAIGWQHRIVRIYEIFAFLYCGGYVLWHYLTANISSLRYVAILAVGSGIFLGLGLLFASSPIGRRLDATESRLIGAIVKKFRRKDNEA